MSSPRRRPAGGRRPVMPLALAAAALALPLTVAAAPRAASAQDATAAVKVPRLDYKVTTLKNGLKVVTLEDRRAPVVTVQVWYRVGSKEETSGKSGFAHLFEHIMFKGSKNVPPQGHSRYVEELGGRYNADTAFDRTRYYETVPVNALDRMLFLEADRMASLIVDAANLRSETDVVKEEYRLRIANAPYGGLLPNVLDLVFPSGHPYAHPPIGSIPDLESANLADVKAFHARYYKPDNATLVLVGDFKTSDVLKKVETYFGGIPKSTEAFTRLPVPAITQAAEKRDTFYDKLAPLPMIGMAYRLPEPKSEDTPVFTVMAQILSDGESARLYRSLVREKQVAAAAGGQNLDLQLGGIFFFFAVANVGKNPTDVESALRAEVARLRDTEVTADELAKAKNQALSSFVQGRLTSEAKANALGEADLLYGTPEEANKQYARLASVTAADIKRVAAKYFALAQTNVFFILPERMRPAAAATSPAAAAPAAKENAK